MIVVSRFRMRGYLLLAAWACAGVAFAQVQLGPVSPPPSNTPPEQKCVVAGRVINAATGEAVKKADLQMRGRVGGYSTVSGLDGRFRFEGVEPGSYRLVGVRSGFVMTEYGETKPNGLGRVLKLAPAQQLTDVDLKLTPYGAISGKVVDQDGEPVENVQIGLISKARVRGKMQYTSDPAGMTDDRGEFRIRDLGPGRYYVRAEGREFGLRTTEPAKGPGKPEMTSVATYFGGAITLQEASAIELAAGQEVTGIDIQLQTAPAYHIRGKLTGDVAEDGPGAVQLSIERANDDTGSHYSFGWPRTDSDHTFDFAGVTPGSYTLVASTSYGHPHPLAREPVEVTTADVNDVVINVVRLGPVNGQVRVEGTPPSRETKPNLAGARVGLSSDDPQDMGADGTVRADGTFSIDDLAPGKYQVSMWPLPSGTYLASVLVGGHEVSRDELDFSRGAAGKLDIVLRYGLARVHGTVKNASARDDSTLPFLGFVMLAPEPMPFHLPSNNVGAIDLNGSFTVPPLPPGHYRAYAFNDLEGQTFEIPDVLNALRDRGVDVELKENDDKAIQLSMISAEDVRKVLERLGIDSQ